MQTWLRLFGYQQLTTEKQSELFNCLSTGYLDGSAGKCPSAAPIEQVPHSDVHQMQFPTVVTMGLLGTLVISAWLFSYRRISLPD